MTAKHPDRGPGVRFPPPLIFLLFMALGYGLESLWPTGIFATGIGRFVGGLLVLVALLTLLFLSRRFTQAQTRIEPWKPTSAIISSGLYAYTRNPIYIAFCLVSIGTGIFLNSIWVLASFIPALVLTHYYVVLKEEIYLEATFGEQYLLYKQSVRRWL